MIMKKRLTRLAPLRAGVVLGTLYGLGGLIAAALYNLVAKWTGGLQFEVSDDTTA
jgi:hypothetical protein